MANTGFVTALAMDADVGVADDTAAVEIFQIARTAMFNMYSDKVIEHFMCPQNAYSMPDADAEGSFGDPACGDSLTIYLKVKDNTIKEISYLVYGCCASIATSSMTSVLAKGKTIDEVLKIAEEDIIEALDGLPENKKHCSNLGVRALRNAIDNYLKTNRMENKNENCNTSRR